MRSRSADQKSIPLISPLEKFVGIIAVKNRNRRVDDLEFELEFSADQNCDGAAREIPIVEWRVARFGTGVHVSIRPLQFRIDDGDVGDRSWFERSPIF